MSFSEYSLANERFDCGRLAGATARASFSNAARVMTVLQSPPLPCGRPLPEFGLPAGVEVATAFAIDQGTSSHRPSIVITGTSLATLEVGRGAGVLLFCAGPVSAALIS